MARVNEYSIKGYELMDLIGEGAYGVVYRARQQIFKIKGGEIEN